MQKYDFASYSSFPSSTSTPAAAGGHRLGASRHLRHDGTSSSPSSSNLQINPPAASASPVFMEPGYAVSGNYYNTSSPQRVGGTAATGQLASHMYEAATATPHIPFEGELTAHSKSRLGSISNNNSPDRGGVAGYGLRSTITGGAAGGGLNLLQTQSSGLSRADKVAQLRAIESETEDKLLKDCAEVATTIALLEGTVETLLDDVEKLTAVEEGGGQARGAADSPASETLGDLIVRVGKHLSEVTTCSLRLDNIKSSSRKHFRGRSRLGTISEDLNRSSSATNSMHGGTNASSFDFTAGDAASYIYKSSFVETQLETELSYYQQQVQKIEEKLLPLLGVNSYDYVSPAGSVYSGMGSNSRFRAAGSSPRHLGGGGGGYSSSSLAPAGGTSDFYSQRGGSPLGGGLLGASASDSGAGLSRQDSQQNQVRQHADPAKLNSIATSGFGPKPSGHLLFQPKDVRLEATRGKLSPGAGGGGTSVGGGLRSTSQTTATSSVYEGERMIRMQRDDPTVVAANQLYDEWVRRAQETAASTVGSLKHDDHHNNNLPTKKTADLIIADGSVDAILKSMRKNVDGAAAARTTSTTIHSNNSNSYRDQQTAPPPPPSGTVTPPFFWSGEKDRSETAYQEESEVQKRNSSSRHPDPDPGKKYWNTTATTSPTLPDFPHPAIAAAESNSGVSGYDGGEYSRNLPVVVKPDINSNTGNLPPPTVHAPAAAVVVAPKIPTPVVLTPVVTPLADEHLQTIEEERQRVEAEEEQKRLEEAISFDADEFEVVAGTVDISTSTPAAPFPATPGAVEISSILPADTASSVVAVPETLLLDRKGYVADAEAVEAPSTINGISLSSKPTNTTTTPVAPLYQQQQHQKEEEDSTPAAASHHGFSAEFDEYSPDKVADLVTAADSENKEDKEKGAVASSVEATTDGRNNNLPNETKTEEEEEEEPPAKAATWSVGESMTEKDNTRGCPTPKTTSTIPSSSNSDIVGEEEVSNPQAATAQVKTWGTATPLPTTESNKEEEEELEATDIPSTAVTAVTQQEQEEEEDEKAATNPTEEVTKSSDPIVTTFSTSSNPATIGQGGDPEGEGKVKSIEGNKTSSVPHEKQEVEAEKEAEVTKVAASTASLHENSEMKEEEKENSEAVANGTKADTTDDLQNHPPAVVEALKSGKWHVKTDPSSGKVYFYNSITKETTWNLEKKLKEEEKKEHGASQQHLPPLTPEESDDHEERMVAAALASNEWHKKDSGNGKMYYYNAKTKETTWNLGKWLKEHPEYHHITVPQSSSSGGVPNSDNSADNNSTTAADVNNKESCHDDGSSNQAAAGGATPNTITTVASPSSKGLSSVEQQALQSGEWVEKKDDSSGRSYYYNPNTRKTTWNLAKELGILVQNSSSGTGGAAGDENITEDLEV